MYKAVHNLTKIPLIFLISLDYAKKRKLKKQNPIRQLRLLEISSRSYLIRRLNVVGSIERVLRRNESLRREIDHLGGLNRALTEIDRQEDQRSLTQELSTYLNSLYLDNFFDNDHSNVPRAQEMFEMGRDSDNRIRTLNDHFTECCDEIKRRLQELKTLILDSFSFEKELLNFQHKETNNNLSFLYDSIIENFFSIKNSLKNNFFNLTTKIEDSFNSFQDFIKNE